MLWDGRVPIASYAFRSFNSTTKQKSNILFVAMPKQTWLPLSMGVGVLAFSIVIRFMGGDGQRSRRYHIAAVGAHPFISGTWWSFGLILMIDLFWLDHSLFQGGRVLPPPVKVHVPGFPFALLQRPAMKLSLGRHICWFPRLAILVSSFSRIILIEVENIYTGQHNPLSLPLRPNSNAS